MIQYDRLLRLADFLDTVPKERFDFAQWAGADWNGALLTQCGTTACALGWATALPEFQALGLRLISQPNKGVAVAASKVVDGTWETTVLAAEEIFGLDEAQTSYLFTPSEEYYTDDNEKFSDLDGKPFETAPPWVVAAHIRYFVELERQ